MADPFATTANLLATFAPDQTDKTVEKDELRTWLEEVVSEHSMRVQCEGGVGPE